MSRKVGTLYTSSTCTWSEVGPDPGKRRGIIVKTKRMPETYFKRKGPKVE